MSPLQLGCMNFGERALLVIVAGSSPLLGKAWGERMGAMTKEQSFAMLDAFYEAGGRSIDTANNYQV